MYAMFYLLRDRVNLAVVGQSSPSRGISVAVSPAVKL